MSAALDRTSSIHPSPTPLHVKCLERASIHIRERVPGSPIRGLFRLNIPKDRNARVTLGFWQLAEIDLLRLMAAGVPEEGAISMLETLRTYDPRERIAVCVGDGARYSFVLLPLR
jgi:hypothetical protein